MSNGINMLGANFGPPKKQADVQLPCARKLSTGHFVEVAIYDWRQNN